jgi:DNA polymerase III epsilon subunit-like protein
MEAVLSPEGDSCAVIMLDTENTGLNRLEARMWQIAARCGTSTFERFIAPDNWAWEPVAKEMFHSAGVDLSHAPPLRSVLADFKEWVRSCCFGKKKVFVAWNGSYDRDILQHEFARACIYDELPEHWVFVDGIQLCKQVDRRPGSWALTAVPILCSVYSTISPA